MTRAEAILEVRRMKAAGEFQRKIVHRIPDDIYFDCFELACGHRLLLMAAIIQPGHETLACRDCMEAWVKAQADGERTA